MFDLILVDFSWIYNKYYFVAKTRPLHENQSKEELKGNLSNMLLSFFKLIGKNYPKAKIVFALDPSTSSLINSELYEGYKKNRDKDSKKEVYAFIQDVVKFLTLSLEKRYYFVRALRFEADQVISYTAQKYHNNRRIVIFSGDKDLLQLSALPNVSISDKFEKGKFILKSDEEIFNKFKNSKGEDFTRISTNKKDILKYRVLKGDTSDNLSPVFPRIKDKEIISIIQDYWIDEEELTEPRIEDIIDDLRHDNEELANKLEENKEVWLRNFKIMNLYNIEGIKIKRILANG